MIRLLYQQYMIEGLTYYKSDSVGFRCRYLGGSQGQIVVLHIALSEIFLGEFGDYKKSCSQKVPRSESIGESASSISHFCFAAEDCSQFLDESEHCYAQSLIIIIKYGLEG